MYLSPGRCGLNPDAAIIPTHEKFGQYCRNVPREGGCVRWPAIINEQEDEGIDVAVLIRVGGKFELCHL